MILRGVCGGFTGVFLGWGSPTPRLGAENAAGNALASRTRGLNAFETLVLRVFGCPIADLSVTYTAVTRINSAFPAISSISNISSGIIAQYAGDVEAEINALISKRYVLPLTVECPILTAIATRETIYRIAVQRALVQFPPAQQGKAPLQVQHEDDQKLLGKIADGTIQLVGASGIVITADSTQLEMYSTTKDYLPTFHEGAWPDMVQDPDKLDDIASDRDL